MANQSVMPDGQLERYRDYLRMLARGQVGTRLQGKIDSSDLVQQTLLQAYRSRKHFRGQSESELASWLRQILARSLADALRRFSAGARDVTLERSLEVLLDESSSRLEALLAANEPSPPFIAERNEQLLLLASAMAQLPSEQVQAIELHHLRGLPLHEVASAMGRSKRAVAGLLFRALRQIRSLIQRDLQGNDHGRSTNGN